ncbi:hypothetical protein D3C78_1199070 [compost metagenome]
MLGAHAAGEGRGGRQLVHVVAMDEAGHQRAGGADEHRYQRGQGPGQQLPGGTEAVPARLGPPDQIEDEGGDAELDPLQRQLDDDQRGEQRPGQRAEGEALEQAQVDVPTGHPGAVAVGAQLHQPVHRNQRRRRHDAGHDRQQQDPAADAHGGGEQRGEAGADDQHRGVQQGEGGG